MTKNERDVDRPNLLHHWQNISFKGEENPSNLHLQTDVIRTKLGHLCFAESLSSTSVVNKSVENYLETYSDLLDVHDGGLNNYAENILKLIEHKKLENDQWKSSFTPENINNLLCIRRFLDSIPEENISEESKLISALREIKNGHSSKSSTDSSLLTSFSNPPKRLKQSSEVESTSKVTPISFCTARDQLISDNAKKNKATNQNLIKKSLGTRRNTGSKFIPPLLHKDEDDSQMGTSTELDCDENMHLKNIDQRMIEMIENEIMDHGSPVTWDDIAGLDFAKNTIKESIVWPLLRPDLFTGLRSAPKGILLFGPPGTGKTMIGKCIASQSRAVFFCISASSLTSKWVGEGEKMVRALFAVARCRQPAVIFIDEIDSLLTHRSDNEHESSRRIKTEFLVQLDGATTSNDDRVLVVGATNRPGELDEAARRRLVKKLFIPLPDSTARIKIVKHLLNQHANLITDQEALEISEKTDGYSGADMTNLCREAALGPIRSVDFADIQSILPHQVRPINFDDFMYALRRIKASVSDGDMEEYVKWNRKFGTEA